MMKKQFAVLLTILFLGNTYAQTDKYGNPVFNSITINQQHFDTYDLVWSYYTLKNNIENKGSSVYVSENPSLDQVESSALKLPADFFMILKGRTVTGMILIRNNPGRVFFILDGSRKATEAKCSLEGDIFENRANEIINEKYDPKAKIENGYLFFNNKKLKIIYNKELTESIIALINDKKLDRIEPSNLSKEDIKKAILAASKEGEALDFFTPIKGKEYDGAQIKPGVFATNLSIALYKWGRGCADFGVKKVEDAYEIYSEIKGRELNEREKDYIKMGFNKELEN
jgi:hypothetical protein